MNYIYIYIYHFPGDIYALPTEDSDHVHLTLEVKESPSPVQEQVPRIGLTVESRDVVSNKTITTWPLTGCTTRKKTTRHHLFTVVFQELPSQW